MSLIKIKDLSITTSRKVLCDKISFTIESMDKVALVAQNGAGKSTVLKAIAGHIPITEGEIQIAKSAHIAYLEQQEGFKEEDTVIDTLFQHNNPQGQLIKKYEQALTHDPDGEIESLMQQIEEQQLRDYESKIHTVINKLKLTPLLQQQIKHCSGGEKKRLALAKVLIDDPDILILDEPTNHLDLEMIERLENYLKRTTRALLLVTHDRYFLERMCNKILELDNGHIYSYPGNYSRFLELKEKRETDHKNQTHKMKQLLKKERERMATAPRARESKSVKREKEFGGVKKQYHKMRSLQQQKTQKIELHIDQKRIGGKILKIHNLHKSFGDKKIVENFSYDFRVGERIGIIGKNGVGKSTFINLLSGKDEYKSGKITRGETIDMALYQQKHIPIREDRKVIDVIRQVAENIQIGGKTLSAARLLEQFLFPPAQQQQKASTLSGGEKKRLQLLKVMIKQPNFLILDEPTNDLDVMTLAILEDFLLSYKGCLVIISHDRFFMDKLVDQLFVFEGDGIINIFGGNYSQRKNTQLPEKKQKKTGEKRTEGEREGKNKKKKKEKRITTDQKKKLSNKERHEFEQLGFEIEELEEQSKILENKISTEKDHKKIASFSQELTEKATQLHQKEERWLELGERM